MLLSVYQNVVRFTFPNLWEIKCQMMTSLLMGKCPFCGVANNWKICPKCGKIHCNSCGKSSAGVKRSAANNCPYCKKQIDGAKLTQKAPDWAK